MIGGLFLVSSERVHLVKDRKRSTVTFQDKRPFMPQPRGYANHTNREAYDSFPKVLDILISRKLCSFCVIMK